MRSRTDWDLSDEARGLYEDTAGFVIQKEPFGKYLVRYSFLGAKRSYKRAQHCGACIYKETMSGRRRMTSAKWVGETPDLECESTFHPKRVFARKEQQPRPQPKVRPRVARDSNGLPIRRPPPRQDDDE